MGRKGWGKAKLEVFANQSKIEKLIGDGMTYTEVHSELLKNKNISCAYRTFQRHARKINILPASKLPTSTTLKTSKTNSENQNSLKVQSSDKPKIFQIDDANSFSYNSEASQAHSNKSWEEE